MPCGRHRRSWQWRPSHVCWWLSAGTYHGWVSRLDQQSQARAAGQAAGLLRGRRPRRADRRGGAEALRRPGLRAQADRAQQARRHHAGEPAARSSWRRTRRCPRARPSSSPPTAWPPRCTSRPARATLKAIDATCPLVTKVHHEAQAVRRRRLRHPAHRPRGARGGHRHRGRGAGAHPAGRRPGRRGQGRRPRPGQGRLAVPDHAVGGRDDGDRGPAQDPAAAAAVAAQRRHLLRHAEPPARDQGDRPGVRRGDRGRLDELVQLGAPGRGRARRRRAGRAPGRLRLRDPGRVAGGRDHGRRHAPAPACPTTWSWRCSRTWPSAASAR